jgi:methionine synthase II (cobalamin-independent)
MLFPTTIAGSLPKPEWLAEPNVLWAPWKSKGDELARAKRDATLLALKLQEDADIDIVTEGEQARQHFVHGFLERIEGIDLIQFDEPAFNVYMDEVNDWGIKALERAAEGLTCATAVHICYGYGIKANTDWKETLGAQWRQYEQIFPAIDASAIQQVAIECRNSKVPLELLSLLKGKIVQAGVIDVASDTVETARAEDRSVLINCKALVERADKNAEAASAPELVRCRQVIREWALRDARTIVDEQGRPLQLR